MSCVKKIKNKIKNQIFRVNHYVLKKCQYKRMYNDWNPLTCKIHRNYCTFINHHKNIEYSIELQEIPFQKEKHKWVGGVLFGQYLYAIPNDSCFFLKICVVNNEISFIDSKKMGAFKWTGGTDFKGYIYAFPRTNNNLLCYNIKQDQCNLIDIGIKYDSEHHYGGVCTLDGRVFQPPRNTDHILIVDLEKNKSKKIQIYPSKLGRKLRYCGSIIHPNGFIYFFPERDMPVIKLNPSTCRWCFIDKPISTMTFDAKVAADGNIYGFSACEHGIMKIDVQKDRVEMIHKEIVPGAYGTKLGIDGCLYSIPGDGKYVWKFQPERDILTTICEIIEQKKAKYAGGSTTQFGSIYGIPAESNNFLVMRAKTKTVIEEEIFDVYFKDCY